MMLTVFGATGAIGRLVVEDAVGAEHEVTAYVRTPSKLPRTHDHLTVIAGELDDVSAVRAAVAGGDAVISALGPVLSRKDRGMPLVQGTRNIVEAMRGEGVSRFVGMATPSMRDPRDGPSLLGKLVPVMGRSLFPAAYQELLAMSQIITSSSLDWTIARFTRPTNGTAKGSVRTGFLGTDRVGATVTRADVASFLVAQLSDDSFHRAAPAISN